MDNGIVIAVNGEEINISNLLIIDETNLSNDFAHQAAVFGWIAKLLADADANISKMKHEREIAYASADNFWRQELLSKGKITEAMVSAAIALDEEYISVKEKEIIAEKEYRVLRALSDALRMRADMLISLGAHIRAEQNMTNMKVNESIDKEIRKIKRQV